MKTIDDDDFDEFDDIQEKEYGFDFCIHWRYVLFMFLVLSSGFFVLSCLVWSTPHVYFHFHF
jgi:hypothetical protein